MAAKSVAIPMASDRTALWTQFQDLAKHLIDEGNTIAGERLWSLVTTSGPSPKFTIGCSKAKDDRVECSLNMETGVVTCKPGPASDRAPFRFEFMPDPGGKLWGWGKAWSLEEALAMILGELVWTQDCPEASGGN